MTFAKTDDDLTPMEEAFCIVCVEHPHWAKADCYLAVYAQPDSVLRGDQGDLTRAHAYNKAHELHKKHYIRERLKKLRAAIAKEAGITEGRALAEVLRIALADPVNLYDDAGNLLPITKMNPDIRAAVAAVEYHEKGESVRPRKVRLWNKNDALEKVLRVLGMYERDNLQKQGLLDQLQRDDVERIVEALRGLGSESAGEPHPGDSGRTTH